LIDWETAGPVNALVELGQACWLNAQLHDDDVAQSVGLAGVEARAHHAAVIADGYCLAGRDAQDLAQAMIDVALADAADQAIEGKIRPGTDASENLWGLAWRTRAAAWMVRHRALLSTALASR
jgi:hypothetical protein